MLTEQYIEVETMSSAQITALVKLIEKERRESEKNLRNELVANAKRMLKNWGRVNAYSSRCGYKNVSSMFSALYPKKTPIYIENEIEFIEQTLLKLKNSSNKKEVEQYRVAECYYKGFDIVFAGSDCSERFDDEKIADLIGISRATLYRRLNSLHSFVVSNASFCDF